VPRRGFESRRARHSIAPVVARAARPRAGVERVVVDVGARAATPRRAVGGGERARKIQIRDSCAR
jgi:hypothetical protein|tara:strand:- start:8252 stop:8446 length:195 start_codon:yes stop_codon:yes gene_type:complete